jgi:16S rRNA (uracil1498-N3)-methyltransferase
MQVFYSPNIVSDKILVDQQEHIHLSKVLRKAIGDRVYVCNGRGLFVLAEIVSMSKKETVLLTKQVLHNEKENANQLVLAVALTKNMDRYEWFIEKAIEIGVHRIIPFYSQNSERRKLKLERIQTIAISAMKQSKSLFLPEIKEPISFKELLKENSTNQKYIAYVQEETHTSKAVFPLLDAEKELLVLIGPEGGFTVEEADLAIKNSFKALSLGTKRLRTETAAVFTAAAYQLLCK